VRAFVPAESDDAIPFDHVLAGEHTPATLALRPGRYVLKITGRDGVIASAPVTVH